MRVNLEICRTAAQLDMIHEFDGQPWMDSGLITRHLAPIDAQLEALTVPTLIMNGEHDIPEFMDVAEALTKQMPNAIRAMIDGGGGFPLWEYPDLVNQTIDNFLKCQTINDR